VKFKKVAVVVTEEPSSCISIAEPPPLTPDEPLVPAEPLEPLEPDDPLVPDDPRVPDDPLDPEEPLDPEVPLDPDDPFTPLATQDMVYIFPLVILPLVTRAPPVTL
jgi:thrombospondin-related uncharacterized protein